MYTLFGLILIIVLAAVLWRICSRPLPCPAYLSFLLEMDNPLTRTNQTSAIIGNLQVDLGMKVLDAGCGPGRLSIPLATKVGSEGSLTALDVQSEMLDRVREKAAGANLKNIHYVQGKIGEAKLQNGYYDRALLITVLGEIADQEAALRQIFDSLRPGGILLITETIFDPHFQKKSTVSQLATKIGFECKRTEGNFFAFTMILEK